MTAVLVPHLAGRAILWSQSSLLLRAQASYFQPNLILLRPRDDYYRSANPEPRDALLVVEVMDSSVYRDRRVKLPLYARARVSEVWLVDVSVDTVEICRTPSGAATAVCASLHEASRSHRWRFPTSRSP